MSGNTFVFKITSTTGPDEGRLRPAETQTGATIGGTPPTLPGTWTDHANSPFVGDDDLAWFESQLPRLVAYAGQWIAIKQHSIVAHDRSASAVFKQVQELGYTDALVVQVPQEVTEFRHYI